MKQKSDDIFSLLGELSGVPRDYIQDIAFTKRFLERWAMDPGFRAEFAADARTAMELLGIPLHPDQVLPFITAEQAPALAAPATGDSTSDVPASVRRFQAFGQEKAAYRRQMRERSEPAEPRMAAWRSRQINRCTGELGQERSDALIHAPAAFELAKGCTVGCWFCGVAAPRFDHTWPYNYETASLWKATLATLRDQLGPCIQQGFLYWATDPFDNPDYERFLTDFHGALGRCPQTTTALGQKDIERTRQLLRLSRSLGSPLDRFSIISINSLHRIHEALSAEELIRVEFIPQNPEAAKQFPKSNAGRARKFTQKREGQLVPAVASSTIACVSGFLLNMIDRSVQLITPCNASDRWPLGYWVLDRGSFASPGELRELIENMIGKNMRTGLRVGDVIRLRPDLRITAQAGGLQATSLGHEIVIRKQSDADELPALVADGTATAAQIAWRRHRVAGVPLAETFALLDHLFARGVLDEEPLLPQSATAGRAELSTEGAG